MKKLILIIAVSLLILSCNETGEIIEQPSDFIIIHGKTYKLMKIVPKKGYHPIWIMYPKDSLDTMPQSINYEVQSGKTSTNETIIKVD